ncbi:hypothetical protein DNI29_15080 [Hymenobacter sediminis]|uniref:hypothetical protein n=1 Tax=Hymenobacter sediminis TaxID=2218621 RepID=UPI000DA647F2|nr:hypothetical protein [Hymenobacter sediminis]RPD46322.1 hypothetical protein DNI29_15080 [Hymenobacter sediminis]
MKAHFISYGLVGAVLSGLTACHFNSSRLNSEQDKAIADKLMVDYFSNQKSNQTQTNMQLFSSRFWQVASRDEMNQIFKKRDEVLGQLQDASLEKWQTKVTSGTKPSGEYQLQYKNTYTKGEAIETFRLEREANDSLKIVYYNINSKEFLR